MRGEQALLPEHGIRSVTGAGRTNCWRLNFIIVEVDAGEVVDAVHPAAPACSRFR